MFIYYLLQYILMKKISTFLLTVLCWVSVKSLPEAKTYGCDIQYCQYCTSYNFCGLCSTNFILQIDQNSGEPYCSRVSCNIPHCSLCYQNGACQVCESGFGVTASGLCAIAQSTFIQCQESCLFCRNSTYCERCAYGLVNVDGECLNSGGIQIKNCISYFSAYSCQLCYEGYAVNPAYGCSQINQNISCNVSNCRQCLTNNSCILCLPGFQPIQGACQPLTCNVPNCFECNTASGSTQLCSFCETGYFLNTTSNLCVPKYMGCNVKNCVSCTNPEVCTFCKPGYVFTPFYDLKKAIVSSTCEPITQEAPYVLSFSDYVQYPVTNCKIFDYTIPGSSILQIGCLLCQDNFVNVGGYCVANLTLNSYTCNIPNCAYCIGNNYCGQCQFGYVAYLGSNQICVPFFSSFVNCQLTGLFQPLCAICQPGYIQDAVGQCVKYWQYGTCNISNCEFCVQVGVCYNCSLGFQLQNQTCTPICNINNCFRCSNSTTCSLCQQNYTLSVNQTNCTSMADLPGNCTQFSTDGLGCQTCNALGCQVCKSGYTLYGGSCCPTPNQNMYGCQTYQDQCSEVCTLCQRGFNLLMMPGLDYGDQCLNVYCSIQNCAYCFSSQTCILCMQNYTISSTGGCEISPTTCQQNCLQCSANGTCVSCEPGYLLYYGKCVCPFQNCLKCMANSYCSVCAYPLTATAINNAGCLPQAFIELDCNISNCYLCFNKNSCAQCNNGYSLSNGTCVKNTCKLTNCLLCNPKNTLCFLCSPGYYQASLYNKTCEAISSDYQGCMIDGCQLCKTSSVCSQCANMFYLTETGGCKKYTCTDNCLLCFSNDTCNVCQYGYYRSVVNGAIQCLQFSQSSDNCSDISGCVKCQKNSSGNVKCLACFPGLVPNSSNLCTPQVCNVQNCQLCNLYSSDLCIYCQQGYGLDQYFQCILMNPVIPTVNCSIYNCLYCSKNDFCQQCLFGWAATQDGVCVQAEFCDVQNCSYCTSNSICYSCIEDYVLQNNTCTPNCSIEHCILCSDLNTCGECAGEYVPHDSGGFCGCPASFQPIDNTTQCKCPAQFTIHNGVCVNCTGLTNCSVCYSTGVCGQCNPTFNLTNGNCQCYDDTFEFVDGSCVCPNNTKLFNNTCKECNIDFCQSCDVDDHCFKCMNNLTLADNLCDCPETFNISDEGFCVCNQGQIAYQDTCYECTNPLCAYCTDENICGSCINNLTLNTSSNNCSCPQNQTFYNNFCYLCNSTLLPYCSVCNATNYCYTCLTGFNNINGTCICPLGSLVYQQSCVSCSIKNCKYCATSNKCSACLPGYTVAVGGQSCTPCNVQNCVSCSSPNYCASCQNSLVPSSMGDQCINCNIGNCSVCSAQNVCETCSQGFYFALAGRNCIRCFLTGCQTCFEANKCSKCVAGYNLNANNTCSVCSSPCQICNTNTGGCLTCMAPYSTNASSNGTCFKCSTPNCLTCSATNTSACLVCATGYNLTQSICKYKCSDLNCMNCANNSTSCSLCKVGYALNNVSTCVSCAGAPTCATCSPNNPNLCATCSSGYYIKSGSCMPCPQSYCDTCNANGCITYKKSSPYFSISINGVSQPATCDFNCISCSHTNPQVCRQCAAGYTLVNQTCIACSNNCKTCSSSALNSCYSCYSNANLYTDTKNNICNKCNTSCLTCSESNANKCTSCPVGYSFNSTAQTCSQGCPQNCQYCSNLTYCTICTTGFTNNQNGQCVPCLSNCRYCSSNDISICLDCGAGLYLSGAVCKPCGSNCQSCNQYGCQTCMTGFYLTASFTCAPNCQYPCVSCSSTTNACYECLAGFTINQSTNKCVPANCSSNCQVCPPASILLNGDCVTCNTSQIACSRCRSANISQCVSCFEGYYLQLSNDTCITCPSGCSTCSSSTNCLSCSSGYVSVVQTADSPIFCQPCLYPCQTCFNNQETCLTCVQNYSLVGWSCLNKYNFGFQVKLNTTLSTFTQNYYAFLEQIVGVFGTNNVDIATMKYIGPASTSVLLSNSIKTDYSINFATVDPVVVSGNISLASNNLQSNASLNYTYGNFSQIFNTSTIAGMQILSYSIAATLPIPNANNDDDNNNSSSSTNLALILGICIPVGLILIGVIIYFVCVYKKKNSPPVNYPEDSTGKPISTIRQTLQLPRSQFNQE